VTINERTGSHGRGIALQDIAAPPHVCLDRISDLARYPKMVPKGIASQFSLVLTCEDHSQQKLVLISAPVKKVEVYEENKFSNVSLHQINPAM
jgi:hypothetical protein